MGKADMAGAANGFEGCVDGCAVVRGRVDGVFVEDAPGFVAGVDGVPPGLRNDEKELIFEVHGLVHDCFCERPCRKSSFVVCDNPRSGS